MDIKLSELRELVAPRLTHSFTVGTKYLIRTVTMYYTGKLTAVTDTDLVLSCAAWIADTGRFHDALKTGIFNEVEPFVHDVIISRAVVIDATQWNHALPEVQK